MTLRPIKGFPLTDDYTTTPVPNAVLGRALTEVEDVDVIKLILRAVWLLERQNGYPRFVSLEQLRSDRVLSAVFDDAAVFDRALDDAIACEVLVRVSVNGVDRLMLNTESARRASVEMVEAEVVQEEDDADDGWDAPAERSMPADAFRAYEENIGILSPMIRQSILAALEDFTDEDITHAIKIAVENESRTWSFVAGVLRRWLKEGVPDDRHFRWPSRGTEQRKEEGTHPLNPLRRNPNRVDQPRVPETELEEFLEHQRRNRSTE